MLNIQDVKLKQNLVIVKDEPDSLNITKEENSNKKYVINETLNLLKQCLEFK